MTRAALTTCLSAILLVSLGAAPSASERAPAEAPPTPEDAKSAYEKGDYKETLRILGRVLSLKGKAADGIDRYEMLMLRAESHMRLKAQAPAIAALEDAAKEAKAAQDDEAAAKARAVAVLIKRSKGLQFTPKVAAGKRREAGGVLDITDAEQRREALEALYEEEKALAKPKVQAADKAKTLPPVATALKAVIPLRDLELAASGKDAETAETMKDLVDDAHKLMAKGLDTMAKQTTRISDRANELEYYQVTNRRTGGSETRTRRRGLQGNDYNELKEIVSTCKKIVQTCKELADGFTEDDEPFEDLEELAVETAERAEDVRKDDYSNIR